MQDTSQALIPGVTITATNTQTGVVNTTVTNEAGAYNFPAILPGIYKLTASLPGFKTAAYDDVNVSPASPVRLNFKLEVGNVSTSVEVSVAADSLLSSSSASIGEVLSSKRVMDVGKSWWQIGRAKRTMAAVPNDVQRGSVVEGYGPPCCIALQTSTPGVRSISRTA